MDIETVRPRWLDPVPDIRAEVARAVSDPVGCPALSDIASGARTVAIVLTDITRKPPEKEMLDVLLAELSRARVSRDAVSLVVATGMHRPNTPDEIRAMYGADIYERVGRIENHDAHDTGRLATLGSTKEGLPVVVNRTVAEADVSIATGVIEVHLWAGYSGGSKTAAIGTAGYETLCGLHSYEVFTRPGVALGNIEGNPFRDMLDQVAGLAGLDFIVNAIQRADGRLVRAVAGHPVAAFREGVSRARRQYEVSVSGPADVVVAVPGYPKDRNLYQASRAVNPAFFGSRPVVRRGGSVIVPARCQDGLGDDDLYDFLAGAASPAEAIERVARDGLRPGGQLAGLKLARALTHGRVVFTDCDIPRERIENMHLGWAPTVEDAVRECAARGAKRMIKLPEPMVTLPKEISHEKTEETPAAVEAP